VGEGEEEREGERMNPYYELVAAKQLGRKAIGIEIERSYCDIAIERLRQSVFQFPKPEPATETQSLFEVNV